MLSDFHVVLLAGGKGARLRPYTVSIPKPLMPIGDLPIVEVILRQLKHSGFQKVTFAVGYLSHLIQAFVGDGSKFGLEIDYVTENEPLGTAGALSLLRDKLRNCRGFLTLNGDILSTLDYRKALDFHLQKNADATICLNRRRVDIDFGVIETDAAGVLQEYREKPAIEYDVSMGINFFSPKALDFVPANQFFNIPDLMLALKNAGRPVFGYKEPCYWLDIGRISDFETACAIFEKRRNEFLPEDL